MEFYRGEKARVMAGFEMVPISNDSTTDVPKAMDIFSMF